MLFFCAPLAGVEGAALVWRSLFSCATDTRKGGRRADRTRTKPRTQKGNQMANWYYQNDGAQHGPVDARTLKQLAASGQIQPSTLLRREDRENWVKAASVKGLLPEGVTPQSKSESSETPTSDKATQASASQSIDWNSWPVICGSLILCFPVGLYLIWKHPTWQTHTRWAWTGGFVVLAVIGYQLAPLRIGAGD